MNWLTGMPFSTLNMANISPVTQMFHHLVHCQRNQPGIPTNARRDSKHGKRPEGVEKACDQLQINWLMMMMMMMMHSLQKERSVPSGN